MCRDVKLGKVMLFWFHGKIKGFAKTCLIKNLLDLHSPNMGSTLNYALPMTINWWID